MARAKQYKFNAFSSHNSDLSWPVFSDDGVLVDVVEWKAGKFGRNELGDKVYRAAGYESSDGIRYTRPEEAQAAALRKHLLETNLGF